MIKTFFDIEIFHGVNLHIQYFLPSILELHGVNSQYTKDAC